MAIESTAAENNEPVARAMEAPRGPGLYLLLLAVQTAGVVMVLMNGVPIYRQMAGDFSKHQSQPGVLWWAVMAAALIQVAYWLRIRLQPPLPRGVHVVISHLVSFVARLSFVLASSSFAVMFLVRFEQLSLSPRRIALVLALLFSMFCYTLELDRLARSLQGVPREL
jgi:uncharacterized membrane-anchored protein